MRKVVWYFGSGVCCKYGTLEHPFVLEGCVPLLNLEQRQLCG